MADLAGREIFAVGKWNGIEFSEADLDDIAANFAALGEIHKVPLKLGHNDEQKVTDGQPALGWVKNVYREGKKLLADFADVPSIIVDAIKKRLYRTVSVELLFNVDNSGKKYGHVLDAVAILGADQPAVSTLADLNMLLATRAEFSGGRRVAFTVSEGLGNQQSNKDFDMDKKEVEELIASAVKPLAEANKDLQARNEQLEKDLKLARDAEDKRTEAIKQEKIAASRKAVSDLLDEAVKSKAMTPAFRETYAKQIGVADDARVVAISLDDVKLVCGTVEQKKEGTRINMSQDDDGATPDIRLYKLTKKYQADHNVADFQVAFTRVIGANPELHREYLVSNGEFRS